MSKDTGECMGCEYYTDKNQNKNHNERGKVSRVNQLMITGTRMMR